MPLKKSCDLDAFRFNVRAEIAAGRDPSQAAAIAYRTLRDACRDAGKPVPRTDDAESELGIESVERYDFTPIGKPERTPQGFVRFPANLTRVGVLTYRKADGTIQKELRHPDEVFADNSLSTLSGCPVTDLHSAMVNPGNVRSLQMGIVGESVNRSDPYAKGSVTVMDQGMIDLVMSGERKEGSPGYTCVLDWTPGTWNGERYDAVQRNIRYNHWALGPSGWGRQGKEVALRLDGNAAVSFEQIPDDDSGRKRKDPKMALKIRIDGIDYELDSEAAKQAIEKRIEKADADAVVASDKASELQGKYDGIVKERDDLKKKLDEANDPKRIDAMVTERADLFANARKVLGDEAKFDGKSNRDIKIDVLKKLDDSFDGKDKTDAYIDGRFDAAIETAPTESRADGVSAMRSVTPGGKKPEKKTDGDGEVDRYDSGAARQRMLDRNRDAWKPESASK